MGTAKGAGQSPAFLSAPGARTFLGLWGSQLVSLFGTQMAGFAIIFWAWQATGSATALALVGLANFLPAILFTPFAGALVDRWPRKRVLILGDGAAALSTTAILLLYSAGSLQVWHLYITSAFIGIFEAFHFPAYSAVITLLVPKAHLGRASGMIATAGSVTGIFAPLASGALLALVGLSPILVFDVASAIGAISIVLALRIPTPVASKEGREGRGSLWKEAAYGFRYIYTRKPLLGVQLVFFSVNLIVTLAHTIEVPMILARSGNDAAQLAGVLSAGAVGGVAGGVLMSLWGGPRRRILGVLGGMAFNGGAGLVLMGVGRSFPVWALASFFTALSIPVLNGSNQALWQSKVPPDLQGRVFATRRLIAQISIPISMALAGPLADFVFEPGLRGGVAGFFSWLVGSGPGAGMALMFVLMGLTTILVAIVAFALRPVREVQELIPDHDAAGPISTAGGLAGPSK